MASTVTKPGKQLGELLQKEQEPFVLNVFLNERGYHKKITRKRRTKGIPSCSRILRAIFNKFAWNKNDESRNTKTTTTDDDDDDQSEGKFRGNEKQRGIIDEQVAEPDIFSSASGRTIYNSFSESDHSQNESPSSLDKHDHDSFEAVRLSYRTEKEVEKLITLVNFLGTLFIFLLQKSLFQF